MSFTGNAGGRFQIRRIRNGSTAECFITANGPFSQTFAEPTGFHTPNWNFVDSNDNEYDPAQAYTTGAEVVFGTGDNQGIYVARRDVAAATDDSNEPTLNDTDDNWEYEGPEGDPLVLTPQLIVNGTDIMLDGTRADPPVSASITGVQWQVSTGTAFENVDTGRAGFSLTGAINTTTGLGTSLQIDRNLILRNAPEDIQPTPNFNDGALMGGMLVLRAVISYNITGVTDEMGNNQVLMCTTGMTLTRTVLTESSMFAQIRLIDTTASPNPSNGSASQIWNSGWTTDKTFRTDLFIGANNVAADATGLAGLTFQWWNSDGMIDMQTGRDLTINRNDVDTAETYYVEVTEVETGTVFQSNSLEIRDFLDPIQFVEVGTSTVDTGSAAMLTVIPYQNGSPMSGLTALNTEYRFEYRTQDMPTDMTGQRNNVTPGRDGRFNTATTPALRFPPLTGGTIASTGLPYEDDDDPVITDGIAVAGHNTELMGVTIMLRDDEVGNFGAFIDYDVVFTMVGN